MFCSFSLTQLSFQIGAGMGSAISGAIWTNMMPKTLVSNLRAVMPAADAAKMAMTVYGNPLKWILTYPPGTPERAAVDESYRHLQRLLCISGLAFSCLLFVVSLFLDNPILNDKRSLEDKEDWSLGSTPSQKEEEAGEQGVPTVDRVQEKPTVQKFQ
jgi:SIT family siderophore-iron:H+ symporter-like MFS transporter